MAMLMMRVTRDRLERMRRSPRLGGAAGVAAVLACVLFGALPAAAQSAKEGNASTRIVNVANASAIGPTGPMVAQPDTAIVQLPTGAAGTTLIATATVTSICVGTDGRLTATGYVDVNNGGEFPTRDLSITVRVQYKLPRGGAFTDLPGASTTIVPAAQLMPGQSGRYDFSVTFVPRPRASYRIRADVTITDHAGYMDTPFGPSPVANVPGGRVPSCAPGGSTAMIGAEATSLDVQLEAGRLEALTGETVPLTATITNASEAGVYKPVAHITLPPELALVPGSVTGVDSIHVERDRIDVYPSAWLDAGAQRTFRFLVSVISAGASTLEVQLRADAADGAAVSPVTAATVRTQRNRAGETRAVIGKVWLDRDGNGRQDDAEPGIAGVEIWTADGSVATTDSTGKFSFADLQPGTYAMRIDPASVGPEYGVPADSRSGVRVDVTGWTTPHVLLPLRERVASVQALDLATRPVFIAAGFCDWARQQLGAPSSIVPAGCGPMQVAANDEPLPARAPEFSVTLSARPGMSDLSFRVPDGWELVRPGRAPGGPGRPGLPRTLRDALGQLWVLTDVDPTRRAATIRLRPLGLDDAQPVRVAPVRAPIPPEEERRRTIVAGPGVQIFTPVDGAVLATDRVYVGVRGEPGMTVTLFDGQRQIAQEPVRIDGQVDFVAVRVPAGPHVLRARMTNSWNVARWDSVHVHTSGTAFSLESESDELSAAAGGRGTARVRVLDRWSVPVVNQPLVTVTAEEATLNAADADASSVGIQVRTDSLGWVTVPFTAALNEGSAALNFAVERAQLRLAMDIVAAVRPLIVIGSAQLGVGAAPRAEGALTVRGHLDAQTAITVSVDSRAADASNPRFGGRTDPMGEGVLPIIGDAGTQRTVGSYDSHLAVRVERGHDYATFGDVQVGSTLDGLSLLHHQRSVRGLAASMRAGGIEWSGFGALTTQSLRQVQLRGAGTSGPYVLGAAVMMGTEQIIVEVRDPLNTQHVLSRQRLTPFMDYEIDHAGGVLLLKQPLPSIDMNGNPLYLMVTFEGQGAGTQRAVWGLRARRNLLARRVGAAVRDSVSTGLTYIRDDQVALGGLQLIGADVNAALGRRVGLRGEVVYADRPDSADVAMMVQGSFRPWGDRLSLDARWARTGREFRNPADLSLVPGTSDFRVGGSARVRSSQLRVEHTEQDFTVQGANRAQTTMSVTQSLGAGLELGGTLSDTRSYSGEDAQLAGVADTKLSWRANSRVQLWAEARRRLWSNGADALGDHFGGGAALQVLRDLALEGRHLQVRGSDSVRYSVTEVGVRSNLREGSSAWGSYQITGGLSGVSNAAIVGMNNRFTPLRGWTVSTMLERRSGVHSAASGDAILAYPLAQQENDYWATGLSMELDPQSRTYHASLKAEAKNGTLESTRMLILAGDLSIDRSVALLARQDISGRRWGDGRALGTSNRSATILGLAVRPARHETFNGLFQLRMLSDENPVGGGVLDRQGRERRLLASAEAIWSPTQRLEVAGRCAVRATRALPTDSFPALESRAVFCGGRYDLGVTRQIVLRGETRFLREQLGAAQRWDVAPSLLYRGTAGIELGGGYRFGELRDADFTNGSGSGWFFTLGLRATEHTVGTLGAYWRDRFGRE